MIPTRLTVRLPWCLIRLEARWRIWRDSAEYLDRRSRVEQRLLDAAGGRKPLPDQQECARLAQLLSVPYECGQEDKR